MLLLEGYISNFTGFRYYFLYVEFSGSSVKQFLAGQTLPNNEYYEYIYRAIKLICNRVIHGFEPGCLL
jgi:hypothetical protein